MVHMADYRPLAARTAQRALRRLAFAATFGEPDILKLRSLYRAWCRNISFDNAHSFAFMREGNSPDLPWIDPEYFFATWLEDGCGGMCIPTASALQALLARLGYAADLLLASLDGAGEPNHLTVCVRLASTSYILDTVGMTDQPVPLTSEPSVVGTGVHQVEVVPDSPGQCLNWRVPVQGGSLTCQLLGLATPSQARRLYQRTWSNDQFQGFHRRFYARTNTAAGITSVMGSYVFKTSVEGEVQPLGRCAPSVLENEFGWSLRLISYLSELGAFPAISGSLRLTEVNRDRVSGQLPGLFSWWLRCVAGVLSRGCRQRGRACAGWPGYGSRRRGGLRAWRGG